MPYGHLALGLPTCNNSNSGPEPPAAIAHVAADTVGHVGICDDAYLAYYRRGVHIPYSMERTTCTPVLLATLQETVKQRDKQLTSSKWGCRHRL